MPQMRERQRGQEEEYSGREREIQRQGEADSNVVTRRESSGDRRVNWARGGTGPGASAAPSLEEKETLFPVRS